MSDLKSEMEKLACLYELTGKDWVLEVRHDLTEPTCSTVLIYPEGEPTNLYRCDRDTIEEGVKASVNLVYTHVVCKKPIVPECPFVERDAPLLQGTEQ